MLTHTTHAPAGWFLFALFGGIGLAATPLDFFLVFKNRPRHMDAQAFAEAQQSLRTRVNELVDIGELIKTERHERMRAGVTQLSRFSLSSDKRSMAREEREALLQFKQAVYLLEEDVQDFQDATVNYENHNALWPYLALLLSFCCGILSLAWFVQLIVYVYPNPPLLVRVVVRPVNELVIGAHLIASVRLEVSHVDTTSTNHESDTSLLSDVDAAFPQRLLQMV